MPLVFLLIDCLDKFEENIKRQSLSSKLIVSSRFFAYLYFQFIVSIIIILLAWMLLYLFNLYLSMPVVVIVSLAMKLE
jgi:hypothetical protein